MNHTYWMVVGCGIPLLLIFLLPLIGVSSSVTFSISIVLMVACHVVHFAMMGRHGSHGHGKERNRNDHTTPSIALRIGVYQGRTDRGILTRTAYGA